MDDEPTPAPSPADDLAARRKELEREFVEKYRDLKAQDKRRRESLELEKQEFESYRRGKIKELADREERLRRTTENKEEKARVTSESLEELDALRRQVKEHDAREWRRKKEMVELETKAATAEMEARATRGLLAWSLAVMVAATLSWLALFWGSVGGRMLALATLAAVLALAWRKRRIRRGREPSA